MLLLLDDERLLRATPGSPRRRRRHPGRCATSSSSTANSSPPKRAAVSLARMLSLQAARDLDQHLIAGGVAEAVVDRLEVVEVHEDHGHARRRRGSARAAACRTRSAKSARLARPVTGSWNAWWASCCSNALRSLTSRPLSTMPATFASCSRFVCEDLELQRRAVAVEQRALDDLRAAAGPSAVLRQQLQQARPSRPRAGARSKRVPTTSRRRVAEHALDRRALVHDGPSAPSTVMRSLACCTSEPKRASLSRRCTSSVSAALSSASETCAARPSSASRTSAVGSPAPATTSSAARSRRAASAPARARRVCVRAAGRRTCRRSASGRSQRCAPSRRQRAARRGRRSSDPRRALVARRRRPRTLTCRRRRGRARGRRWRRSATPLAARAAP